MPPPPSAKQSCWVRGGSGALENEPPHAPSSWITRRFPAATVNTGLRKASKGGSPPDPDKYPSVSCVAFGARLKFDFSFLGSRLISEQLSFDAALSCTTAVALTSWSQLLANNLYSYLYLISFKSVLCYNDSIKPNQKNRLR